MIARFRLNAWLNILVVSAISITCLLLTLPREAKFGYEYDLGQPWHYAPLIATFEFPINKSAEQLKEERDSALKTFYPYFDLRTTIGIRQIRKFKADYAQGKFAGVPTSYVEHAIQRLKEVYEAGVVELEVMNKLVAQGTCGIRIITGTTAVSRDLGTVFSPRTAYEHMMSDESFSREIMTRLNLHDYIDVNLLYDARKTADGKAELLSGISGSTGMVLAGERIIDRGDRVSASQKAILDSLKQESERRKQDGSGTRLVLLGQLGLVCSLFAILVIYLRIFRRDYFRSPHAIYLIFSLLTIFPVLSSLLMTYKFFSVYIIPFVMVPIILRVFTDTRTAFVTHCTMIILASIPLHTNYQFVVTELFAGLVGIYCIKELTERSQILLTALIVTICTGIVGFFFDLMQGVGISDIDRSWYWYIIISGIALLFTYPLLYLIEQLFGFTSSVTLIELSNINTPLIRRMAKVAQGTFVHSMQVGNLAAEVAAKIGAKVQLVRTGALYHDIGKMLNPGFFTENQGQLNPHDQLPEEQSAQIIISHVTEGARLADKHRLPKAIRDFILTHHGKSLVKYFYVQAVNKHGEENVDKQRFTYPGPNPFTLEQAILMMADAVEASSRSLTEYSEESISALVNRIIDGQVASGAFNECPITFRDITEAKRTFIDSLKTIYHTRIAYPEIQMGQTPAEPTHSTNHLFDHLRPRKHN